MKDELLKVKEAADQLKYKVRKVFSLLAEGELERVKLSPAATRIPASSVQAFIERKRKG